MHTSPSLAQIYARTNGITENRVQLREGLIGTAITGGKMLFGLARDMTVGFVVSQVANSILAGGKQMVGKATGGKNQVPSDVEIDRATQKYLSTLPPEQAAKLKAKMADIRAGVKQQVGRGQSGGRKTESIQGLSDDVAIAKSETIRIILEKIKEIHGKLVSGKSMKPADRMLLHGSDNYLKSILNKVNSESTLKGIAKIHGSLIESFPSDFSWGRGQGGSLVTAYLEAGGKHKKYVVRSHGPRFSTSDKYFDNIDDAHRYADKHYDFDNVNEVLDDKGEVVPMPDHIRHELDAARHRELDAAQAAKNASTPEAPKPAASPAIQAARDKLAADKTKAQGKGKGGGKPSAPVYDEPPLTLPDPEPDLTPLPTPPAKVTTNPALLAAKEKLQAAADAQKAASGGRRSDSWMSLMMNKINRGEVTEPSQWESVVEEMKLRYGKDYKNLSKNPNWAIVEKNDPNRTLSPAEKKAAASAQKKKDAAAAKEAEKTRKNIEDAQKAEVEAAEKAAQQEAAEKAAKDAREAAEKITEETSDQVIKQKIKEIDEKFSNRRNEIKALLASTTDEVKKFALDSEDARLEDYLDKLRNQRQGPLTLKVVSDLHRDADAYLAGTKKMSEEAAKRKIGLSAAIASSSEKDGLSIKDLEEKLKNFGNPPSPSGVSVSDAVASEPIPIGRKKKTDPISFLRPPDEKFELPIEKTLKSAEEAASKSKPKDPLVPKKPKDLFSPKAVRPESPSLGKNSKPSMNDPKVKLGEYGYTPLPKAEKRTIRDTLSDIYSKGADIRSKGIDSIVDSTKKAFAHGYSTMADNPGKSIIGAAILGALIGGAGHKIAEMFRDKTMSDDELRRDIDHNLDRYLKGQNGEVSTLARVKVDSQFRRHLVNEIFENTRPNVMRPGQVGPVKKFAKETAKNIASSALKSVETGAKVGTKYVIAKGVNLMTLGAIPTNVTFAALGGSLLNSGGSGKTLPGSPHSETADKKKIMDKHKLISRKAANRDQINAYRRGLRDVHKAETNEVKEMINQLGPYPSTAWEKSLVDINIQDKINVMDPLDAEKYLQKWRSDKNFQRNETAKIFAQLKKKMPRQLLQL